MTGNRVWGIALAWLLAPLVLAWSLAGCGAAKEKGDRIKLPDGVPAKVAEVLRYIDKHKEAPPGHVGGRTFENRERRLPPKDARGRRIKYQEWDVNRKVRGKNRGPERLVTGSDGSAYYTGDHYKTFKKIR